MTYFAHDNLPDADDMALKNPLSEELLDLGRAAVIEALESGEARVEEVKAVYAFDRKDYLFTEPLGMLERNKAYSSDEDDIILQMTVRIPNPKKAITLEKVAELEEAVRTQNIAEAKALLTKQIAVDAAAAVEAEKRVARLAELNAL